MLGSAIGPYRIREKLGEDRAGALYLALDERLDRLVALRQAPSRLADDPDAREAFLAEVRRAAAIEHPAVSRIHELGEQDGRPFVVTALDGDRTLEDVLTDGPVEPLQALGWAIEIAGGLGAIHAQDLTHGALAASSIGVGPDGAVSIRNLGFPPALRPGASLDLADSEAVRIASPELCSGADPSAADDLWALAVLLHRMLSGDDPFQGAYPAAVVYAILNEEPAPLASSVQAALPGVDRVLTRALDKDPDKRFGDAAALGAALGALRRESAGPKKTTSGSVADAFRSTPQATRRTAVWTGAAALAAALGGAGVWLGRRVDAPVEQASLAVLPLRDLVGDDEDYFADGMTEELITSLAQIGALRVISRTSVLRYRDRQAPLAEIARTLDVDYVLDGSIQRQGDRVRIHANLIDLSNESNVWAGSYDRDLTDVFALQSQVAREIAAEVRVQLTPEEQLRLAKSRTVSASSFETYLRARHLVGRRTVQALEQARSLLEDLTSRDADFALGYAGLANVYVLLANYGAAPPGQLWPLARDAAEQAAELDPNIAEPRSTLGLIESFYAWDWRAAEQEYLEALRLNPGHAIARQRYGIFLSRQGRHVRAVEELEFALELDPLSISIAHALGVVLFMAGRLDEAKARFQGNGELAQSYYRTNWYLGRCHLEEGRFDEALAELETAVRLSGENSFMLAAQVYGLGRAGRLDEARVVRTRLTELEKTEFVSAATRAIAALGLGDIPLALNCMEDALVERASILVWLKVDPMFNPLRGDSRFERILAVVGLDG